VRADSDVDLVVDMAPERSLHAWSALWQELEAVVGSRIDLAIASDLRPEVRRVVLEEAVPM
jgi:uncharacterized protein